MQKVFGEVQYIDVVCAQSLEKVLGSMTLSKPEAILILCCDEGTDNRDSFTPLLQASTIPIVGGIFPNVVFRGITRETGMLVIPIHIPLVIKCYEDLQHSDQTEFDLAFEEKDYTSLLVLVDGLSRNIDHALNKIFDTFGQSIQVFGGGAGSLSLEPSLCLFTPNGMLQDGMIIIAMKQEWSLAIGHGWEILDGPFIANKVDHNHIIELNFRPAFEVYNEVIEKFTGISICKETFFEACITFPFGIERLDGDVLVRDPIALAENALVCVGTVPDNTMLYILKGVDSNLVNAAQASVEALNLAIEDPISLLFDCISRKIFLNDEFDEEIKSIGKALGQNKPLLGALVLGEIASNTMGGIDLHNKTAVTAVTKQCTAQTLTQ